MTGRILVLGAAGRFGRAAAEAFRDAGWSVSSLVRPGAAGRAPMGTEILQVRISNRAAITDAARGADIVLHALNPPYTEWARHALPLAYVAIEAAETSGATLMFPGNLYNYGRRMPVVLDETTPMRPTARKGQLRVLIEDRMREASDRGMRTVILRAGDFFGSGRGSWFDLVITKDLAQGRVTYPGPFDLVHEWAYVPDFAAAMVRLAAERDTLPTFATFGFPGHAITGRELGDAISRALKRDVELKRMTWWFVRTFGRILALGRELAEIAYLWEVPHRIDGDRLRAAIGEVPHTPLDQAIAHAVDALAVGRRVPVTPQ
jgi:nucleoside-diphosphate-sugar epimerase